MAFSCESAQTINKLRHHNICFFEKPNCRYVFLNFWLVEKFELSYVCVCNINIVTFAADIEFNWLLFSIHKAVLLLFAWISRNYFSPNPFYHIFFQSVVQLNRGAFRKSCKTSHMELWIMVVSIDENTIFEWIQPTFTMVFFYSFLWHYFILFLLLGNRI